MTRHTKTILIPFAIVLFIAIVGLLGMGAIVVMDVTVGLEEATRGAWGRLFGYLLAVGCFGIILVVKADE